MYPVVIVLHGFDTGNLLQTCRAALCSKMLLASHFITLFVHSTIMDRLAILTLKPLNALMVNASAQQGCTGFAASISFA